MKIDWLAGTITKRKIGDVLQELKSILGEMSALEHGSYGYESSALVLKSGRVYWHYGHPEMGVFVSLPSSALDNLDCSIEALVSDLNSLGMTFKRVDFAWDDTTGLLDMKVIGSAIERGQFVTRWKRDNWNYQKNGKGGQTWSFGSRSSDSYLRIYDKAAEQNAKGKTFFGHWVRVELELKDERANAAITEILANRSGWRQKAGGWLLGLIDFKVPGQDSNRSRWQTASWWSAFLNFAQKARIFVSRWIPNAEDLREWIEKQVTPSLFVLLEVIGWQNLLRMIGEASERLKEKHLRMIDNASIAGYRCEAA